MPTLEQIEAFRKDGFFIARNLFDAEEIDLLQKIGKADFELAASRRVAKDASGKSSNLTLWNELSEDIYSAFVRCPRIVEAMEAALGDEVYHYHHKMMQKEPFVGVTDSPVCSLKR